MNYSLIGLSGMKRSGKDSTAEILQRNYGFSRLAFADKLREALLALNPFVVDTSAHMYSPLRELVDTWGWEGLKTTHWYPEIRRLLQYGGTEMGRNTISEEVWVSPVMHQYAFLKQEGVPAVISDVRFSNEAKAIRHNGGIIIEVQRTGVESPDSHPSEAINFEPDFVLDNNSTLEDLESKVDWIMHNGN